VVWVLARSSSTLPRLKAVGDVDDGLLVASPPRVASDPLVLEWRASSDGNREPSPAYRFS